MSENVDIGKLVPVGAVLPDALNRINYPVSEDGQPPVISNENFRITASIPGWNETGLVLLGSRPGMGKTALSLSIGLEVGEHLGKSVAYFSLEMSKEQLASRLLACKAQVNHERLLAGNLQKADWEKVVKAASMLAQTGVLLDDTPLTTASEVYDKCAKINDLGLVVIDYLQLMNAARGGLNTGESRQQTAIDISRILKNIAEELQVPVLCLSQLPRTIEKRRNKRPVLSDLRESNAVASDADVVLFLFREDYYNDFDTSDTAELIVAKNRYGETGTVKLKWMPETLSFREQNKHELEG